MAPVAAGIAILVAGVVPPSRDPRTPPVDWAGLAMSAVGVGALIFTIIEAPVVGWLSGRTVAGFAASVAVLAGFLGVERRRRHPMLDVGLFRNLRFTAASGAVTVAFFALSGFIFLVTQYLQFLKAYSPFATGVRLLPVAASVAISSLVGTRLAVRVGNKLVVTTGLSLLCGAFVWISTASQASTYLEIAAQVLVLGTGMGLTSAPATEAIMGVVSKEQAGVGSAVNDATRLLGGTLGVAVMGSVAASLYAGRLGSTLPAGLPAAVREAATGSVGGAIVAAQRAAAGGLGAAADQLRIAAIQAFEHSFAAGCLVALGVAAAGALVAWFALPARPSAKGHSGSGLHATGCALQTAIAATCSRVGGPRRSGSASPSPRSSGSTR